MSSRGSLKCGGLPSSLSNSPPSMAGQNRLRRLPGREGRAGVSAARGTGRHAGHPAFKPWRERAKRAAREPGRRPPSPSWRTRSPGGTGRRGRAAAGDGGGALEVLGAPQPPCRDGDQRLGAGRARAGRLQHLPMLGVTSPTPRCGKTTCSACSSDDAAAAARLEHLRPRRLSDHRGAHADAPPRRGGHVLRENEEMRGW